MKICSTCKRTYADDTLVFCMEDGTRLSAAYDPGRVIDPDKTEILPAGLRPTEQLPSPPRSTNQTPPPDSYYAARVREKRSRTLWVVLSGVLALIVVGLIVVAGFFAWKASDKPDSDFSRASFTTPTPIPTPSVKPVVAPNANRSPEATVTPTLNWLEGVWEGEGYQTDTKTTWAIRLTVRNERYSVEYPDIPCQGRWDLIDKNSRQASFTEVLSQGTDRCGNNSHVIVEKVSDSEISVRYTHEGSRTVIATVVLSKKSR